MLVVSEFVGCSPSVSGAIRVNPWSIDSLADGIYTAIKAGPKERHLRHDKHWRYVSQHTVRFWAQVRARFCHFPAAAGTRSCLAPRRDFYQPILVASDFLELSRLVLTPCKQALSDIHVAA